MSVEMLVFYKEISPRERGKTSKMNKAYNILEQGILQVFQDKINLPCLQWTTCAVTVFNPSHCAHFHGSNTAFGKKTNFYFKVT